MALFTHPISKQQYWLYKDYDEPIRMAFNLKVIELFRTMIRTFIILAVVAVIVAFVAWTLFRPPLEMIIATVVTSLVTLAATLIVVLYLRSETNRNRDLFTYRTVGANQNWLSFQMLNGFAIGQELLQWPSPQDTHWIDEYFVETEPANNTAHHHRNSLDPSAITAEHAARKVIIGSIEDLLRQTSLSSAKETVLQQVIEELSAKAEAHFRQRIQAAEQAITHVSESYPAHE